MTEDTDPRGRTIRTPRTVALARAIREARGTTVQVDFAKAVKRPQAVISTWEHGKTTPSLETLYDLEQRMGLPAGTLAYRAGYFTPEAIAAEIPATPRFHTSNDATGVLGAIVTERRFAQRDDALHAVRAADDLGLGVRLTKDVSQEPLWSVEIFTAETR